MSIVIPPSPSFLPNVYNYSPQNLKKWRAAIAGVKAGVANARILCIGDSTTFGTGANGAGSGNWRAQCYPTRLAGLLNAAGVNAEWNSFFGGGRNTTDQLSFDSRIVVGSVWSVPSTADTTMFGGYMMNAQANTNALSFTPTVPVDTFVVYYPQLPSGTRGFNIQIDSGTPTSVNPVNALNQMTSATITASLGTHTLNITQIAGSIYIAGIDAYDSSKKWISVMNAGWRGSTSVNWNDTTNPYGPVATQTFTTVAPTLTIINLAINDWNAPTSLATYKTNIQAIITAALTTGDVILVAPNPSDVTAYASLATQASYVAVLYQLAAANNLILIDIFNRWGSYASSNSLGINYDGLHPNGAGYADLTRLIMNVIGEA